MPWRPRREVAFLGSAIVGIAVASLLVIGLGPSGLLLQHVQTCQLGAKVGTFTIWSPEYLVNIPDQSNASFGTSTGWNYTMTSGSLTVGALGPDLGGHGYGLTLTTAGIDAIFGDVNWTFYRTENVSAIGSVASPCTQPYVAMHLDRSAACESQGIIPIPDNSSDLVQPHVWNSTQEFFPIYGGLSCRSDTRGAYDWFDTSFHASQAGTESPLQLNLCNWTGGYPLDLVAPGQIPIVVYAPYGGGLISAGGLLTWQGSPSALPDPEFETATYTVPSGWVWEVAPVGPSTSPIEQDLPLPNLVAFERLSCPA